jgi:plasmid stability protein
MATIQIRDVPDDVHRTYRRRAADAGMSLQEYLLGELVDGARSATPAEVVAQVRRQLAEQGEGGFAAESSAGLIRAARASA